MWRTLTPISEERSARVVADACEATLHLFGEEQRLYDVIRGESPCPVRPAVSVAGRRTDRCL